VSVVATIAVSALVMKMLAGADDAAQKHGTQMNTDEHR